MRLSIINITIIGLLLITGCSTKDKNSNKEVKVLSVKETKLNPGIYNVLESSSQVLWECEWLGGARHDGSVQLVSGSIDISSSSDVNGKFIVDICTHIDHTFSISKVHVCTVHRTTPNLVQTVAGIMHSIVQHIIFVRISLIDV